MPKDWTDLTDPKYKDQYGILPSGGRQKWFCHRTAIEGKYKYVKCGERAYFN